MTQGAKRNWKKKIVPLAFAFAAAAGLAGCENLNKPADVAVKPQIVQQMVSASANICADAQAAPAAYAARLNETLTRANASDLRAIADHHLTLCLDQRLMHQEAGFWDHRAQGVLTRDADGRSGLLTLWDNGVQPEVTGSFFNPVYKASSYSPYILHAFALALKNGQPVPGGRVFAIDAPILLDGGELPNSSWMREADMGGTVGKNPWLLQPPVVKAPMPKAGS